MLLYSVCIQNRPYTFGDGALTFLIITWTFWKINFFYIYPSNLAFLKVVILLSVILGFTEL